jgi:hypothetical protein
MRIVKAHIECRRPVYRANQFFAAVFIIKGNFRFLPVAYPVTRAAGACAHHDNAFKLCGRNSPAAINGGLYAFYGIPNIGELYNNAFRDLPGIRNSYENPDFIRDKIGIHGKTPVLRVWRHGIQLPLRQTVKFEAYLFFCQGFNVNHCHILSPWFKPPASKTGIGIHTRQRAFTAKLYAVPGDLK